MTDINPCTGLPLIDNDSLLDIGGNVFGTGCDDLFNDDFTSISSDDWMSGGLFDDD